MMEELSGSGKSDTKIIFNPVSATGLPNYAAIFDKVFLLVDENTNQYCLPVISGKGDVFFDTKIIIPSGEANKNLKTVEQIWKVMIEEKASRRSLIINLGGGVVTDIGGFAAATFMRGISFINVPTTLLAMVDASIGGKTGIDFDGYKNYIGAFRKPEAVYIFPSLLESLDLRQIRAGFAEMIKHALIADTDLWDSIRKTEHISCEEITPLLPAAIDVKTEIIQRDFREQGERKKLNFGHTVGHAIESYFLNKGKGILHGEAVAAGMLAESFLAKEAQILAEKDYSAIRDLIEKHYTLPSFEVNELQEIFHWMRYDKKNEGDMIYFSLPDRIGHCLVNRTFSDIRIQDSLSRVFS